MGTTVQFVQSIELSASARFFDSALLFGVAIRERKKVNFNPSSSFLRYLRCAGSISR